MNQKDRKGIPIFAGKVPAGFPSPADEYVEAFLDLNELLVQNKQSTFLLRASGDSMLQAGIFHDDILVVDRSLSPKNNQIVVASIDGEFLVKRLINQKDKLLLLSENPKYKAISIHKDQDFYIWGVVTYVIHKP